MPNLRREDIEKALLPHAGRKTEAYWKSKVAKHYPSMLAAKNNTNTYEQLFLDATQVTYSCLSDEMALMFIAAIEDNDNHLKTINESKKSAAELGALFESIIDSKDVNGKTIKQCYLESKGHHFKDAFFDIIARSVRSQFAEARRELMQTQKNYRLTDSRKAFKKLELNEKLELEKIKKKLETPDTEVTNREETSKQTSTSTMPADPYEKIWCSDDLSLIQEWLQTCKREKNKKIPGVIYQAIINGQLNFLKRLVELKEDLTSYNDYVLNNYTVGSKHVRIYGFFAFLFYAKQLEIFKFFLQTYPKFGYEPIAFCERKSSKKRKFGETKTLHPLEFLLPSQNEAFIKALLEVRPKLVNDPIPTKSISGELINTHPLVFVPPKESQIALILLSYGSDPASTNCSESPFTCFILSDQIELIEYCLNNYSNPAALLKLKSGEYSVLSCAALPEKNDNPKLRFAIFKLLHDKYKEIVDSNGDADIKPLEPLNLINIIELISQTRQHAIADYLVKTYADYFVEGDVLENAIKENMHLIRKYKSCFFRLARSNQVVNAAFCKVIRKNNYKDLENAISVDHINFIRTAKPVFDDENFKEVTEPLHLFVGAMMIGSSAMTALLEEYKVDTTLNKEDVLRMFNSWSKEQNNAIKKSRRNFLLRKYYYNKQVRDTTTTPKVNADNNTPSKSTSTDTPQEIALTPYKEFIFNALGHSNVNVRETKDKIRVEIPYQLENFKSDSGKVIDSIKLEQADMALLIKKIKAALDGNAEAGSSTLVRTDVNDPSKFLIVPNSSDSQMDSATILNEQIYHFLESCKIKNETRNPDLDFKMKQALEKAARNNGQIFVQTLGVAYEQLYLRVLDRMFAYLLPKVHFSKYFLNATSNSDGTYTLQFNFAALSTIKVHSNDQFLFYETSVVMETLVKTINEVFKEETIEGTPEQLPVLLEYGNDRYTLKFNSKLVRIDKIEAILEKIIDLINLNLPDPMESKADHAPKKCPETSTPAPAKPKPKPKQVTPLGKYITILRTLRDLTMQQKEIIAKHFELFSKLSLQGNQTETPKWVTAIHWMHLVRMLEQARTSRTRDGKAYINLLRNLLRHLFDKLPPNEFKQKFVPIINIIGDTNQAAMSNKNNMTYYFNAELFKNALPEFENYVEPAIAIVVSRAKTEVLQEQRLSNNVPAWILTIKELYESNDPLKKDGIIAHLILIGECVKVNKKTRNQFRILCRSAYRALGHDTASPYEALRDEFYNKFVSYCEKNHVEWLRQLSAHQPAGPALHTSV